MYVVHVIPFIRGTHVDTLSYFSSQPFGIGSIVQVPIRGKQHPALVVNTRSVSAAKSSVRSAHFSLRKLPKQTEQSTIPAALVDTASALAQQYPARLGSILYQLLPADVRSGTLTYPSFTPATRHSEYQVLVLTQRFDERLSTYARHVRQALARKESVMIVAPSAVEVDRLATHLGSGIEQRCITISSHQAKRARERALAHVSDQSSAKLIICTPAYAFLDRPDLSLIIVEQASSGHYRTRSRPYLDLTEALRHFAKVTERTIILGDVLQRSEVEQKRREELYTSEDDAPTRIAFPAALELMVSKKPEHVAQPFVLFPEPLLQRIRTALSAKQRVFLLCSRRGLAPVVTCVDCGHIFRCPESNSPYSLLRTTKDDGTEERWFVSGTSGRKVRAADTCPDCGSWRLRERGVGIQHVADEWQKLGIAVPCTILDHTTASTDRKARALIESFSEHSSGVLIGTQLALPYLAECDIHTTVVMSLEAARAIPSWRADETFFRQLLQLRELSAHSVLVNARTEPDTLLTYAARGALERFYDDELKLRELLGYPPFTTLVLASWLDAQRGGSVSEHIKKTLTPLEPQYYRHPLPKGDKTLWHALINLQPSDTGTYQNAIELLSHLPPQVKVEVNPDRIV